MLLARVRSALPRTVWLILAAWFTAVPIVLWLHWVRGESPTTHLANNANGLVNVGAPLGALALTVARGRATVASRFLALRGGFVARPATHVKAVPAFGAALWWGYVFSGAAFLGTGPLLAWSGVLGVALVVATVVTFTPRPMVVLTAAGVTFRGWPRTRRVDWDDITAVEFPLVVEVRDGEPWRLRESLFAVHPGYTADAIGYYRLHPEFRELIGTEAENDRLHAELSDIWARRLGTVGGRPGQG
ncbi:PH domain-containing protein [Longispora sp. K20-0274]|uniref:PH domain-containing protein n=1 Tax=Longispora sp. K20-0274 TaxID=3088255 RepID=UPI00399BF407